MAQGDKSAYTDKQKRQAEHIEDGYRRRGMTKKSAQARAWATVNKQDGGGKLSGSGRGKKKTPLTRKKTAATRKKTTAARKKTTSSSTRSKKKATRSPATTSAAARSRAAKKGWATRRKKAASA